jgi:hypothetical protein
MMELEQLDDADRRLAVPTLALMTKGLLPAGERIASLIARMEAGSSTSTRSGPGTRAAKLYAFRSVAELEREAIGCDRRSPS